MKIKSINKNNVIIIAFYHVAIAAYLVGVSVVNAGCNQLGGLLGGATQLTDHSELDGANGPGSDENVATQGAALTQGPATAPYGLRVNPLPANTESAIYGIFDIPR
jgi:hypothetical protein